MVARNACGCCWMPVPTRTSRTMCVAVYDLCMPLFPTHSRACSDFYIESHIQRDSTALTLAASEGHTECVRLLLDAGADTSARAEVRRADQPRCFASARMCWCLFQFMILSHVKSDFNAFLFACDDGGPFVLRRLFYFGNGAFISQLGYTALIKAAKNGHIECVRLLLDAGADKDAADQVCF